MAKRGVYTAMSITSARLAVSNVEIWPDTYNTIFGDKNTSPRKRITPSYVAVASTSKVSGILLREQEVQPPSDAGDLSVTPLFEFAPSKGSPGAYMDKGVQHVAVATSFTTVASSNGIKNRRKIRKIPLEVTNQLRRFKRRIQYHRNRSIGYRNRLKLALQIN
ncbi:hypothetical protein QE152_g37064 [Popillia japonica]|uniref:Uncharacterized protein n=1 Tax=Popillia japonica TaxID=7064 RepID=A0AAW1IC03_POPJA